MIQRASLGETIAFELLADFHRSALQSLASRMLRNADDANDAVQETLVKAFRSIKHFDSDRPLRPWLCRICCNCCVDAIRNRKHAGDSLDAHDYSLAATGETIDEKAEESMERTEVIAAVARLPEHYRRIIFMRHFKHMDVNEIAQELDKPEGTIKSWLFRARAMLKKDLTIVYN